MFKRSLHISIIQIVTNYVHKDFDKLGSRRYVYIKVGFIKISTSNVINICLCSFINYIQSHYAVTIQLEQNNTYIILSPLLQRVLLLRVI